MASPRRLSALLIIVVILMWTSAGRASAHTGFETSDPAEGAVVDGPVEELRLVFTNEATPVGDGIQVLDPGGTLHSIDATSSDGRTWIAALDPPLEAGVVGVRWTVQAPDAHPISGSFTFTVTGEPENAPTSEPVSAGGSTPTATVADEPPADGALDDNGDTGRPAQESDDLAAFLAIDKTSPPSAEFVALVGRVLGLEGTAVAIGGFVFAVTVLGDQRRDAKYTMAWVRRAGALIAGGAVVEAIAQVAITGGQWSALPLSTPVTSTLFSTFGVAIALRVTGGVLLVAGARPDFSTSDRLSGESVRMGELVGAGSAIGASRQTVDEDFWAPPSRSTMALREPGLAVPVADPTIAFAGVAALALSYLFDGHTVTAGNRYLTGLADVAHVIGGSVWAGGVMTLLGVLLRRRIRNEATHGLLLVLRFSVVATVALVAVAVAGTVLAATVLDHPAELWTTGWGRFLIAKVLVVGVAVAAGGYNHHILIPGLERHPDAPDLWRRFRTVVAVEAGVMLLVIVATAFLVGAPS